MTRYRSRNFNIINHNLSKETSSNSGLLLWYTGGGILKWTETETGHEAFVITFRNGEAIEWKCCGKIDSGGEHEVIYVLLRNPREGKEGKGKVCERERVRRGEAKSSVRNKPATRHTDWLTTVFNKLLITSSSPVFPSFLSLSLSLAVSCLGPSVTPSSSIRPGMSGVWPLSRLSTDHWSSRQEKTSNYHRETSKQAPIRKRINFQLPVGAFTLDPYIFHLFFFSFNFDLKFYFKILFILILKLN